MDVDDDDRPTAMTHEQLSRLLDAIRDPSIMRKIVGSPLLELVHVLLLAELEGTPDVEIYVENRTIGLLTALRPHLTSMVDAFFELPPMEHTRREELLAENEQAQADFWREENDPDDELQELTHDEMDRAYEALEAAVSKLSIDERKRLAYDFVTKPEAMIRNVMATEVFRKVVALTEVVEEWTHEKISAYNVAVNAPGCNNLLPILRDLRRSLS